MLLTQRVFHKEILLLRRKSLNFYYISFNLLQLIIKRTFIPFRPYYKIMPKLFRSLVRFEVRTVSALPWLMDGPWVAEGQTRMCLVECTRTDERGLPLFHQCLVWSHEGPRPPPVVYSARFGGSSIPRKRADGTIPVTPTLTTHSFTSRS